MNILKKIILFSTLFAVQAQAGFCTTNYCDARIKLLYVHPNTNVYIQPEADMTPLNCTLDNGSIVLKKSHEMHEEIYSALLSTSMSDWTIRLRASDTGSCELIYVQIRR